MGDNNSRFTPEQVALLQRIAKLHKELVQLGLEVEETLGIRMNPSCSFFGASNHDEAAEMMRIMGLDLNAADIFRFAEPKHCTKAEPYGWSAMSISLDTHPLDNISVKFPLREGE